MSFYSDRPQSGGPRIRRDVRSPMTPDSGLTVIPPTGGAPREDSFSDLSSSSRKAAPRTNGQTYARTPRRTPTPTKQVSLQAARKKEEPRDIDDAPFDWQEYERVESARLQSNRSNHANDQSNSTHNSQSKHSIHKDKSNRSDRNNFRSHDPQSSSYHHHQSASSSRDSAAEEMLKKCYKKDDVSDLMKDMNLTDDPETNKHAKPRNRSQSSDEEGALGGATKPSSTKAPSQKAQGDGDIDDSDQFDTDLEDAGEEEEEEKEEEKRSAPNELLMEFLDSVMKQEWKDAQKLCRMILMYEPDHPEAKEFQATIEEKVLLEEELANMSSEEETDEEGEEGDEDDDDDDDSESGDSDDSDESDDEGNEDDDDTTSQQRRHDDDTTSVADSGIASVW